MTKLRDDLSKIMNQKKDSKTIVFAIKMFWYWARNIYDFVKFSKEIFIPIDSRLTKLFEKFKWKYTDINKFYLDLSKKLNIPMLHLDWIIWTLYDDLIKEWKDVVG
jgi:DNA-(apurinic or apyrimidinic site) lyase